MRGSIEIRRAIGDAAGFAGDLCEYAEAAVAAGRTGEYAWIAGHLKEIGASHPDRADLPARLAYACGLVLEAIGDPEAAECFERGRRALSEQLAGVADEETRRYLSAQPFNRALLARPAPPDIVRGTRKARRSS